MCVHVHIRIEIQAGVYTCYNPSKKTTTKTTHNPFFLFRKNNEIKKRFKVLLLVFLFSFILVDYIGRCRKRYVMIESLIRVRNIGANTCCLSLISLSSFLFLCPSLPLSLSLLDLSHFFYFSQVPQSTMIKNK